MGRDGYKIHPYSIRLKLTEIIQSGNQRAWAIQKTPQIPLYLNELLAKTLQEL